MARGHNPGPNFSRVAREKQLEERGWCLVGVDEAGRGPWAGPVVASAVVLPSNRAPLLSGLNDSKQLTHRQRRELEVLIHENARGWALGEAQADEIDALGIVAAVSLAVERALRSLRPGGGFVLADGPALPRLPWPGEAVVRGDQVHGCVSAASVLAKLHRDRIMESWHGRYPQYGFDRHKGYGTPLHREALEVHGPCVIHRHSFKPVKKASRACTGAGEAET